MQRLHAADAPGVLERFHEHLYLVEVSAKQMIRALRWRVDLDELVSAGREGLWEAARRYDPDSSVPFKGFAGYRVRGAMIDHLRRTAAVPRRAPLGIHARRSPFIGHFCSPYPCCTLRAVARLQKLSAFMS